MASFHELKASAPRSPGESGVSSTPNQGSYYGWEVTRKVQQPRAEIPTVSPTDVTPSRILRAMRGEFNLPTRQFPANSRGRRERVAPEWELLRQAREKRKREARLRRNCGNGTTRNHYEGS